jgi:hypothetical protein
MKFAEQVISLAVLLSQFGNSALLGEARGFENRMLGCTGYT